MFTLSVCLEMMWLGFPFEDRIQHLKNNGYMVFEFWGWKTKNLTSIRTIMDKTSMSVAAICMEPNFCLVDRGNDDLLISGVIESAKAAHYLSCNQLILTTGHILPDETFEITRRRVIRKLRRLVNEAENNDVVLLLEPLNRMDEKGYWLTKMSEAVDIVQELGSKNLKILYDLYHQQLTEGNLINNLQSYLPWIGHIHVAGVPGRSELIGGEIDYGSFFHSVKNSGYNGYLGLEFTPKVSEEHALKQAMQLLSQA